MANSGSLAPSSHRYTRRTDRATTPGAWAAPTRRAVHAFCSDTVQYRPPARAAASVHADQRTRPGSRRPGHPAKGGFTPKETSRWRPVRRWSRADRSARTSGRKSPVALPNSHCDTRKSASETSPSPPLVAYHVSETGTIHTHYRLQLHTTTTQYTLHTTHYTLHTTHDTLHLHTTLHTLHSTRHTHYTRHDTYPAHSNISDTQHTTNDTAHSTQSIIEAPTVNWRKCLL